MDALAMLWANARVAHLLLVNRMTTVEEGDGLKKELVPGGYDQLVYTQNVETIEPFSYIVSVKGPHGRMHYCHGASLVNQRWLFATGPHCTEHIH